MGPTYVPCEQCGHVNRVPLDPLGRTPICGSCKARLEFHDGISEVSGTALTNLVRSSPVPVIVDFWAEWCGPCKAFAPVYARLARERFGDLVFAKLNTEKFPIAAEAFGIRGVPTLVVFANGVELGRQPGGLPEHIFRKLVDEIITETSAPPLDPSEAQAAAQAG